jgi:hypothetical protein
VRDSRTSVSCRNCGSLLQGPFCSDCGQEARDLDLTLREMLGELLGNLMSFDSRVWRTAVPLLFLPGDLTARFLAGQRVRFVPPVRLYVFVSLVYFLLLALLSPGFQEVRGMNDAPDAEAVPEVAQGLGEPRAPGPAVDDPDRLRRQFLQGMSYLMFFLMPAFAGLVKVAYRGRGRPYLHHLLFAVHLHAFLFALLIVAVLLEASGVRLLGAVGGALPALAVPVYLFVALQRVYGGRWWVTLLRTGALGVSYLILLSAAVAAMAYTIYNFWQ